MCQSFICNTYNTTLMLKAGMLNCWRALKAETTLQVIIGLSLFPVKRLLVFLKKICSRLEEEK